MSQTGRFHIEEILALAGQAGASDVHLTTGLPPKMRLNGSLVTVPGFSDADDRMTGADTQAALREIMKEEQLRVFEERGEYDMSFSLKGEGRYRVNAFRQRGATALALRLVSSRIPSPEQLGVPASIIDLYRRKRGLVLVTGPTGSGKSTTLAAIIDKVNEYRDAHVITLEDPIEYLHRHKMSMVNQREIGQDTRSYADALRAALREDPDVILVGEMRDYETISVAVTAAETGHLVLSSLHASSVVNALNGIFDLFPPDRQEGIRGRVAEALEAVVSQRLLPSGDGRSAAFEVLLTNPDVRRIIREGGLKRLAEVMRDGAEQGMLTVEESVRRLYSAGKIDRDTAARYLGEQACRE